MTDKTTLICVGVTILISTVISAGYVECLERKFIKKEKLAYKKGFDDASNISKQKDSVRIYQFCRDNFNDKEEEFSKCNRFMTIEKLDFMKQVVTPIQREQILSKEKVSIPKIKLIEKREKDK